MKPRAESFDKQLEFLHKEVVERGACQCRLCRQRLLILLSLAESVKSARDHQMNCPAYKEHRT